MKKTAVVLCLGVLLCSLCACGKDNPDSTESTQNLPAQTQGSEPAQESEPVNTQEPEQSGDTDAVQEGWSAELQAVRDAVAEELGENYWPDTAVTPDLMEPFFGITEDMYDDYLAESPMISMNVDTLLIVKAKEGKLEDLQEAINSYREGKINDTMQYPYNIGKIHASRIETIGDYVCFVQLGADATGLMDSGGDDAVIEYCQEQNELALEIIRKMLPHE